MKTMFGSGALNQRPPAGKLIARVLFVTALVLLVPLVAMQFTSEVAWTLSDFVTAGALLLTTGLLYVLSTQVLKNPRHRLIAGIVLLGLLFTVWVELAVGIFH